MKKIFSGSFWLSHEAKDLGLIDGIYSETSFFKSKYGEKTKIKKIKQPKSLKQKFQRLTGINISDGQWGKIFQADPEGMKDLLSDVQNSTTSAHDVFQKQHHSDDRIPSFWGRENKDDTWKPRYDTKKVYKIINAYKQLGPHRR